MYIVMYEMRWVTVRHGITFLLSLVDASFDTYRDCRACPLDKVFATALERPADWIRDPGLWEFYGRMGGPILS